MGRSGQVLADRYHVHLLKTPREVRHALRYVLLNARKHAGKARERIQARITRLDPASSGRWFDGWRRDRAAAADVGAASSEPPVARARTWLLSVGWRRHGLIDPADVPG